MLTCNIGKISICIFLLVVQFFYWPLAAQTTKKEKALSAFTLQLRHLDSLANLPDPALCAQQVEQFWEKLKAQKNIPLVIGDSVAFLYKDKKVDSVSWQGDFNGWGGWAGGQIFRNKGHRIGKSDIWIMKAAFPKDARLDYKVVRNGREWVLDPANPYLQWGGGGPNSELRMPNWKPEPTTFNKAGISKGILSANVLIKSRSLGYELFYKVYLPARYEQLTNLPVVYVTDGQEYADEKMGAMINVLDNLIAEKKIKPVIAVFLDPRQPTDFDNNRRMLELPLNEKFLDFVSDELVPAIDSQYKTNSSADARAIMGTSLGGLNAAYFGIKAPQKFHLLGIHSPAFWYRPKIYELYENSSKQPLKIFMTTGVMSDTDEGARKMKLILEQKKYTFHYKEVNEGHSWGNWRSLIDDLLIYFFKN